LTWRLAGPFSMQFPGAKKIKEKINKKE